MVFILTFAGCGNTPPPTGAVTIDFHVIVTNTTGSPLSGVKVVSEDQPAGQLKITGSTDDSGNAFFNDIAAGDYKLYISRFDYNNVEVAITITPENSVLTVKMTPASTTLPSPATTPVAVTFAQLIGQPDAYNNRFVILEGYYFSGFEIVALASALAPASYNPDKLAPVQPLIWVEGNLGQEVYENLQHQTDTPSGYTENFGRIRITGQFIYGGKYGHLDAYNYKIMATGAELLP